MPFWMQKGYGSLRHWKPYWYCQDFWGLWKCWQISIVVFKCKLIEKIGKYWKPYWYCRVFWGHQKSWQVFILVLSIKPTDLEILCERIAILIMRYIPSLITLYNLCLKTLLQIFDIFTSLFIHNWALAFSFWALSVSFWLCFLE